MENEEKEIKAEVVPENEELKKDVSSDEEESDFADEVKPTIVEAPIEEKPVEEEEEKVSLYAEEETNESSEEAKEDVPETKEELTESKEKGKKEEPKYEYSDAELEGIETARKNFHAIYKKLNLIKWIITGTGLALVLAGWIVPSVIKGINANITMYISLGVTAVIFIGLFVYSTFFRKKVDKAMKAYFKEYYDHTCKFVYPDTIESLNGTVDDKLPQDIFLESNIYKDVVKVGSRAYMTFNYKGLKALIADCAAQKKGERQLETLFVGKFLKFEGITSNDELLIYFKGNKRALPPNSLHGRKLIEDSRSMVIYGSGKARSLLTKKVREALAQFDTNKIFIDMAITVNEKGLFFAMGYEDDLMVLPLEKPFNPAPTIQNKEDIEKVLALVDAFSLKHGEEK